MTAPLPQSAVSPVEVLPDSLPVPVLVDPLPVSVDPLPVPVLPVPLLPPVDSLPLVIPVVCGVPVLSLPVPGSVVLPEVLLVVVVVVPEVLLDVLLLVVDSVPPSVPDSSSSVGHPTMPVAAAPIEIFKNAFRVRFCEATRALFERADSVVKSLAESPDHPARNETVLTSTTPCGLNRRALPC